MDLKDILLTVRKPGRYIGGEWNAVKKDWIKDRTKVLLAFPDSYEVGSSHLGMKILYGILNGRDDCLCERVFSPWPDLAGALRKNSTELFSLESHEPIKNFDIIGFSLSHELCYTNVLEILDLGALAVRSSERGDGDPVVIAGGPCCFNPEPMAEFIDAFVIGDGEEAILDLVKAYKRSKAGGENGGYSKKDFLKQISAISGVYVPSLYGVDYNEDRTIKSFGPLESGVSPAIQKRLVDDLDKAFYPVKQIVPNVEIVHDRIAIEIMRGCKHACKFCQATAIYRPCRERSVDTILELARQSYELTGYDEISLLSLSSVDYSRIKELTEALSKEFTPKGVSISVPSLRIEEASRAIPALVSKVKKSGLTFAPETASADLRKALNKNISIDRLFDAVEESFKNGWRRVKLYFMIGLPGESQEDVVAISEMAKRISDLRRKVDNRPAQVAVSVNAFVPKPHTFFEREAMEDMGLLEKKRAMLKSSVKSRDIELSVHSFQMSYIEALLSRGDRRVSKAIYAAWREGSVFDSWQEHFNFERWVKAISNTGLDPDFYVSMGRKKEDILPWGFIK